MQTPKMHWTACLWPGLAHLWNRGSWAGLALAVGFTALLNVLLLATFVFSEWITGTARLAAYGALLVIWLLAWWQSRADWRRYLADWSGTALPEDSDLATRVAPSQQDDLWFVEAQQSYLAGDWVTTEQLLLKLLKQNTRDVESRLFLATLWRHQGRCEEAVAQLDRLERLEAAGAWQHEIAAEREAIHKQKTAESKQAESNVNESNTNETNTNETSRRLAA